MAVQLQCFREALEPIARAQSADELLANMQKFSMDRGFDKVAYTLRITASWLSPREFLLARYPAEWIDRYVSRNYFKVDPVVRHFERNTLPVMWDESSLHTDGAEEFWQEARSYGLRAGLSFAVHEQFGVTGIFSLCRSEALDLDGRDLAALIGHGQMFASQLHRSVARMDLPQLMPGSNFPLTERERECIWWAADGKTARQVAKILGITERTANFHLKNATRKLGAVNKTHAIARAIALRLL